LITTATQPEYIWVDDPKSQLYNQFATLPLTVEADSYENLFLLDNDVYDVCVVVGYNDDPIVAGKGSAIFFHVASPSYGPTAGCISLSLDDLLWVLRHVDSETLMAIQ